MIEEKLVVIIIVNYNNKEDTLICLDSISKLNYSTFRIVLVDNGSEDCSAAAVQENFPDVHLIESSKNLGAAGGRNLAINYVNEKFNYRFLFFLDNDIIIESNALAEMVKTFDYNENVGIVSPKCYVMGKPEIIKYAGGLYVNFFTGTIKDIGGGEKDSGRFNKQEFVTACGGLCLVKKEVIEKIRCFDERFNPYGWEDVDFSIRAGESGYKILYNPGAVIYHKGGKTGRGKGIGEYESAKAKNYFYFLKKHTNFFQKFILSLVLPFKIMLFACKEIFKGDFDLIRFQLGGFFSLFKSKSI